MQIEKHKGSEIENYCQLIKYGKAEKIVFYKEFGSYTGDWICISCDDKNFKIYKGCYGSCSGCDTLRSKIDWNGVYTLEQIAEAAKGYKAFLSMPIKIAKDLDNEGIRALLPANERYEFDLQKWAKTIRNRIQKYLKEHEID